MFGVPSRLRRAFVHVELHTKRRFYIGCSIIGSLQNCKILIRQSHWHVSIYTPLHINARISNKLIYCHPLRTYRQNPTTSAAYCCSLQSISYNDYLDVPDVILMPKTKNWCSTAPHPRQNVKPSSPHISTTTAPADKLQKQKRKPARAI